MTQLELQDAIIKHALDLQRLSANEEAEALAIIREMEDELRRLLATASLTDAKKREVEAIIKEAEAIIAKHYDDVAGAADIRGITVVVAEKTVDVLRDILPAVAMPSAERLASLSRDILIDGAPASAWWARQSEDTAFKFAREVREGVLLGEAQERIVSRIVGRGDEPGILDTARRNVRTLVHSSVMTAANRARLETYRKNMASGDTLYWLATLDGHVCPVCMALDGSQWDRDGNPVKGNKIAWNGGPPAHFSCFTEDTAVLARGAITGASKRWFDGDVVVVKTASGRKFTCTPNHPILTDRGWVPAGLLDVGSNVVCDGRSEWKTPIDGDGKNTPAFIHDVAEAVINAAPVRPVPMVVSAPDFHGDGKGSDVAIVWSDRLLLSEGDATICQHGAKVSLVRRGLAGEVSLATGRHLAQGVDGFDVPSGGFMGSSSQRGPLFGRCPAHSGELLLASVSDVDARLYQADAEGGTGSPNELGDASDADTLIVELDRLANVEFDPSRFMGAAHIACEAEPADYGTERQAGIISDLLARFSGEILLDDVISADRIPFAGHVYNLETTGGWYLAQGVVSHNCRCTLSLRPGASKLRELVGDDAIDAVLNAPGRASKDGPTSATSMQEFLKRQSPEFIEEMLGKGRAELFLEGKITVKDLVSGTGRELSLAELRAR